jgi:hypothetical protein
VSCVDLIKIQNPLYAEEAQQSEISGIILEFYLHAYHFSNFLIDIQQTYKSTPQYDIFIRISVNATMQLK